MFRYRNILLLNFYSVLYMIQSCIFVWPCGQIVLDLVSFNKNLNSGELFYKLTHVLILLFLFVLELYLPYNYIFIHRGILFYRSLLILKKLACFLRFVINLKSKKEIGTFLYIVGRILYIIYVMFIYRNILFLVLHIVSYMIQLCIFLWPRGQIFKDLLNSNYNIVSEVPLYIFSYVLIYLFIFSLHLCLLYNYMFIHRNILSYRSLSILRKLECFLIYYIYKSYALYTCNIDVKCLLHNTHINETHVFATKMFTRYISYITLSNSCVNVNVANESTLMMVGQKTLNYHHKYG